jgi:hypothetical protein
LTPPLVVGAEEVVEALDTIEQVLAA